MIKARTKLSIADIIVCVVALAIALCLLLIPARSDGYIAYVKTDEGETYLDLTKDATHTVISNGYALTIEVNDGKARVSESGCPDKICQKTGWIEDSTSVIVCAPAKVLIRIQDHGGESDADFIAGR